MREILQTFKEPGADSRRFSKSIITSEELRNGFVGMGWGEVLGRGEDAGGEGGKGYKCQIKLLFPFSLFRTSQSLNGSGDHVSDDGNNG